MGEDAPSSASPVSGITGLIDRNLEKIAKQSRGLVLLAAIVAIAVLGLAVAVDHATVRLVGVGGFVLLMLVITGLLYMTTRASSGGGEEVGHAELGQRLRAVNGRWWQLVRNDASPGLTLVAVDLSVLPDRHHLEGRKYDPAGKEMAFWRSRAVGLMQTDPVDVFYYWEGWYSERTQTASGVGFFNFPRASETGGGWFTTGDVERGDFAHSSKVHLRRVSPDEQEVLARGGAEAERLIRERYEEWVRTFRPEPVGGG